MVAFARPALGCAHTVGFTDVFIARDGPPQQYSAGSGVKSVVIVLLALSFRSFAFVQVCTSSKYG